MKAKKLIYLIIFLPLIYSSTCLGINLSFQPSSMQLPIYENTLEAELKLFSSNPDFYVASDTNVDTSSHLRLPPIRLVDSFEDISNLVFSWWDRGEQGIYKRDFVHDIFRSGLTSMRIDYSKLDESMAWD